MAKEKQENMQEIAESLSPNERTIMPFLNEKTLSAIDEKTNLGKTAILRALEFLSNKRIIEIRQEREKIIALGINGINYLKNGLPERRLINSISEKASMLLQEAKR